MYLMHQLKKLTRKGFPVLAIVLLASPTKSISIGTNSVQICQSILKNAAHLSNNPSAIASGAGLISATTTFLSLKTVTKLFPLPLIKDTKTIAGASIAIGISTTLGLTAMLLQKTYTDKKFAETNNLIIKSHTETNQKIENLAELQKLAFARVKADFCSVQSVLADIQKEISAQKKMLGEQAEKTTHDLALLEKQQREMLTIMHNADQHLHSMSDAIKKNQLASEETVRKLYTTAQELHSLKTFVSESQQIANDQLARRIEKSIETQFNRNAIKPHASKTTFMVEKIEPSCNNTTSQHYIPTTPVVSGVTSQTLKSMAALFSQTITGKRIN